MPTSIGHEMKALYPSRLERIIFYGIFLSERTINKIGLCIP